jgi:hypothetical protein
MNLKCQCCGFEQEFESGQAAFDAGWDAPPHFTGYICCNLCPGVCIVLGLSHAKAHAHWNEHGRPAEFNDLCLPDKDFGKPLKPFVESGKEIAKIILGNNDAKRPGEDH